MMLINYQTEKRKTEFSLNGLDAVEMRIIKKALTVMKNQGIGLRKTKVHKMLTEFEDNVYTQNTGKKIV